MRDCWAFPFIHSFCIPTFQSLTGEPAGARTQDPVIKSHMLYQLSYRPSKRGFSSIGSGCSKGWKAHKVEDGPAVVKSQTHEIIGRRPEKSRPAGRAASVHRRNVNSAQRFVVGFCPLDFRAVFVINAVNVLAAEDINPAARGPFNNFLRAVGVVHFFIHNDECSVL